MRHRNSLVDGFFCALPASYDRAFKGLVLEFFHFAGLAIRDRPEFAAHQGWYNGYDFGGRTIYNPWSILNFFDDRPQRPRAYWANTSGNDLVKELVIGGGLEVREQVESLIRGEAIDENIVFPELRKRPHNLWSLLFFSCYLKCLDSRVEDDVLRVTRCSIAPGACTNHRTAEAEPRLS